MRLDFRFSERALEDLWCEAVVALVFQGTFLNMGTLSGLDAKLGGILARREAARFWDGAPEEDLLVASQGRIKADKILLCGLGPVTECNADFMIRQVERVGRVLKGLHVTDFAIHIPMLDGAESEYSGHLEASVHNLTAAYLQTQPNGTDPQLKIVFSVGRFFKGSLIPLAERIRERYGTTFDVSVVVERGKREIIGA